MRTLKNRFLSATCMFAATTCLAMAEPSTTKSNVTDGETLVTIDNKQAGQHTMSTTIPGLFTSSINEDVWTPTNTPKYQASDFSYWGISYWAPFEFADEGFYMAGIQRLFDSGWGLDFRLGANYGLVDSDFAAVAILAGPTYGYVYNNILLSTSLDFVGVYAETGKKEKTTDRGNKYIGSDLKFDWGLALMPKVAVRLGNVIPWAGINAQWTKGANELSLGFEVGIGFRIDYSKY